VAFAVPAATIRRVLPEMLDAERRAGVVTGLELAAEGGCKIRAVQSGSPAATAGLEAGDTIVRVAGRAVADPADYHLALLGHSPHEKLPVEVLRGGKSQSQVVTLAERPKAEGAALAKQLLGLELQPLTPQRATEVGLRVPRGLAVQAVIPEKYAGLADRPQPGDVLVQVGAFRPRDAEHLGQVLEKVRPGDTVKLVLCRKEGDKLTRIDVNLVLAKGPSA
jgi:S1-C subfamily serine protease